MPNCIIRIELWFLIIVIQHLPRISGWQGKHFRWRITLVGSIVCTAFVIQQSLYTRHCWLGNNSDTPAKLEKTYLKACCTPFHTVSRKHVIQPRSRTNGAHLFQIEHAPGVNGVRGQDFQLHGFSDQREAGTSDREISVSVTYFGYCFVKLFVKSAIFILLVVILVMLLDNMTVNWLHSS